MANEKNEDHASKQSGNGNGNGNGAQKYPELITNPKIAELIPDPKDPHRYTLSKPDNRPNFELYHDLYKRQTTVKWLIRNYLELDTFTLMYGESGSHKTFLAIDMLMHICTGKPWCGCKVDQGPVAFIAGEGHSGITRRIEGWLRYHGFNKEGIDSNSEKLKIAISTRAFNMLDVEDVVTVKADIDKILKDEPPKYVVIDTLSRNFGGGNENSAQDINTFTNNVNNLLRARWGCCLMVVHHVGHMEKERARGSSATRAALDVELFAKHKDGLTSLEHTKVKEWEKAKPRFFKTKSSPLHLADEDGVPYTTLVLQETDEVLQESKEIEKTSLRKNQIRALEVLINCFHIANQRRVARGDKTEEFIELSMWQEELKFDRRRFYGVKTTFIDRKIIKVIDTYHVYRGECYYDY